MPVPQGFRSVSSRSPCPCVVKAATDVDHVIPHRGNERFVLGRSELAGTLSRVPFAEDHDGDVSRLSGIELMD